MARKKLLYVARPQSGGMLKHLRVIAAYFSAQWDVSIAAPPTVLAQVYRHCGALKYFQLPLTGCTSPLRDVTVSVQLVKICRREKIELLHAHGFKAAFVALPAAKICCLPLLITVHNSLLYSEKSIFPSGYYYRALKSFDSLITGYITVSDALRQELAGWGIDQDKITRIYNGIDLREFRPVKKIKGEPVEREIEEDLLFTDLIDSDIDSDIDRCNIAGLADLKAKNSLTGNALMVGTAGRLVSHKGMDVFLKAAGRIVSSYDHVYFFIAGEGPERNNLEHLRDLLGLQEKVFFLGHVKQMASFLAGLDIFVLASRSEGLSISLLEAGCAGLPLIASATGGIPEIVRDGETGILVPAEDELSLAEALAFLIGDSEKRKSLGLEAARDIQKRFTEDNMLKETEKVYDEILRKRTGNTVCFGKSV